MNRIGFVKTLSLLAGSMYVAPSVVFSKDLRVIPTFYADGKNDDTDALIAICLGTPYLNLSNTPVDIINNPETGYTSLNLLRNYGSLPTKFNELVLEEKVKEDPARLVDCIFYLKTTAVAEIQHDHYTIPQIKIDLKSIWFVERPVITNRVWEMKVKVPASAMM